MIQKKIISVTIDATGKAIGRIASEIAIVLQGKHRADFVPHQDGTEHVRVEHLNKAIFTGNKVEGKVYHRHSGYPGGLKTETLRHVLANDGLEEVLRRAVKRMLPNNRMRTERMKRIDIV